MRLLGLAIFLVTYAGTALGVKEYYSLSRSVRALGMGGAFHGLSDDEYAPFYNPAGLASYRMGGQLLLLNVQGQLANDGISAFNTLTGATRGGQKVSDVITQLQSVQGKPLHAAASIGVMYARPGFALAILVADVKANVGLLSRDLDAYLDATALEDSGVLVSKSFTVNPALSLGVTAKGLFRAGGRKTFTILDFARKEDSLRFTAAELGGAGVGIDLDIGAVWEFVPKNPGRFGAGLVLQNALATTYPLWRLAAGPPGLPRLLSGGLFATLHHSLSLRLDYAGFQIGGQSDPHWGARQGSAFKHVHAGAEYHLGFLALRAGLYQGNWTAGLGIATPFVKVDFATYAEELFLNPGLLTQRRFAVRLAFGVATPPLSPLAKKAE